MAPGPPARLAALALVALLGGCADAPRLMARGTDPERPRGERREDLREALATHDPGVAQDLTTRVEVLLLSEGPTAAADRACALDTLDALIEADERAQGPLAVRLADEESPLVRSRPALERLARHPRSSVRDLARDRLRRLPPPAQHPPSPAQPR